MKPSRVRGFTLVELMVASAIASVVVAAALAMFGAMATQQRSAERMVEANAASMVAVSTMRLDVQSAGYRLPVPAFVVRSRTVTLATSLPSNPGNHITTMVGCGTGGLVEGTDVLEVATGYGLAGPGKAISAAVTGGADIAFTLGNLGEPFATEEANGGSSASGVGSVLVFANSLGNQCMARVTSLDRGTGMTSGTATLIDRDFVDLSSASFYPGCPTNNMRVYRLGSRTRYMVCADAGATPNQYALYRQEAGVSGKWEAPAKYEDGIEDLQVALALADPSGTIALKGSSPTCLATGGAGTSFCYCDDKLTGACSLTGADVEPGLTALGPGAALNQVRGLRVQLTSVGQRLAHTGDTVATLRRPDSFDHPGMAATAADNYYRTLQQFAFSLQNLQVTP